MSQIIFGADLGANVEREVSVDHARALEKAGFDFVSVNDHPSGAAPTLETWTLMSWIAASTKRISIASRVLGVPYRPPPMVAKMAETLARLSGGRLILGLGAGSSEDELRAFGFPQRPPGERIDGLRQAVEIIRGLWREPRFSYEGSVYRVANAPFSPRPSCPIPIWLGTFGRRSLSITGELADGWIPTLGHATKSQLFEMRRRVLESAVRNGRAPGDVTCVLNFELRLERRTGTDAARISGTSEAVAEQLLEYAAGGFTAFNVIPVGSRSQLRQFADEVIPLVRAGSITEVSSRTA